MSFVHLHVHSEYSFLDGACRLKNLVARAKELGMPALALTDHGGMHGAIEFYQLAKEAGVKPIIGCEVYVAPGNRFTKTKEAQGNFHLTLLARNFKGYQNLVKLVSRSHLEGFYHKPRVDKELLGLYSEGLIALSGCLMGEIPRLLRGKSYREAVAKAYEYQKIFGQGNFYLELQNHGRSEEILGSRLLQELGRHTGIPVAATNDVHYVDQNEAPIQEILTSMRTAKANHDPKFFKSVKPEFYLKSAAAMTELFRETPEAINNTLRISEQCQLEIEFNRFRLPNFPVAGQYCTSDGQDVSQDDLLLSLCRAGIRRRYPAVTQDIRDRMEKEIKIIREMKFASYFLIVADIVNFARSRGIPVGPGRGSAGGSFAAYVLGITNVDPIKHNLFFERFLNPERPDLPDIDLDFCQRRRDEVLAYLSEKYGSGNVAQIGIFSTLGARGAIRDTGKALGIPENVIHLIAANLPHFSGQGGLEHALNTLPEFKKIPLQAEPFRSFIEKAKRMEGRIRHTSIHAAGVVISQAGLSQWVPLQLAPGGEIVTQYGPESLKALGLIKIDLLGLRNLTIIHDTLQSVVKDRGLNLTVEEIPIDDSATYTLLRQGDTLGCFQLESSGMRSLLKKLKPVNIDDLIAILALYRPGPWDSGLVEGFLRKRQGQEAVNYPHRSLEPVLKDTYGLILFQEQVMQVANVAAGYSMGEADLLRRAIAKRLPALREHRIKFIKGCLDNGFSKAEAENVFELLSKFAGYSFNKAHSTGYALISYQTAFLKANYPVEYLAALLSSQTGYYGLAVYVEEARRKGIQILPPCVNRSFAHFTVEGSAIRAGLSLIKGLGFQSALAILDARKQKGPFKSYYDFWQRVDRKKVNRTVVKNLINVGALDGFGLNRPQLLGNLEMVLKAVRKSSTDDRNGQTGQLSFWDLGLMEEEYGLCYNLNIPDYTAEEKSRLERELLNISLREHPLAKYQKMFIQHGIKPIIHLPQQPEGSMVTLAGVVVNCRRQPTRNKEYMLFILLEDQSGQIEVIVFPSTYQKYLYELNPEGIIVKGKLVREGEQVKVIAESLSALEIIMEQKTEHLG